MRRDLLSEGMSLPEYRVSAPRPAEAAENLVHDDRVAQGLGFKAGLVPGFIVYAWMTHPVVEALGIEWIASGTFSVRFARPIYYEEPVTVQGRVAACTDDAVSLEIRALNAAGEPCATATMGVAAGAAPTPDPASYPAATLPAERPPVSREHLSGCEILGTPELLLDEAVLAGFLSMVKESLPIYVGAAAPAHPAFYLDQANCALDRNVRVNRWLHVESAGRHLNIARAGERLFTRGKIKNLYERKGHEFVELDLLLVAGHSRPVASIRHVAIYRLRQAV